MIAGHDKHSVSHDKSRFVSASVPASPIFNAAASI
jgi:hypothetical protein